jgi:hypothetical protein
MEAWYCPGAERGEYPSIVFQDAYDDQLTELSKIGFRDEDEQWHEAGELGVAMLDHYVDVYGEDDEYEVVAKEQKFEMPVVSQRGNTVGIYVGVLDLLMRHKPTGYLEIWDHKTAKQIKTNHLALDSQKSGYWTFGVDWLLERGILRSTEKLRTIRFNFLRKALPDTRAWKHDPVTGQKLYLNMNGSVSQKQPTPYFLRQPVPMSEAERDLERLMVVEELRDMALVRAGKLGIYKNPSMFNCPGCPVREICELHQVGGDYEEMAALTMQPKNTWKPLDYKDEAWTYDKEH